MSTSCWTLSPTRCGQKLNTFKTGTIFADIGQIPFKLVGYGPIENLPEQQCDTIYIVSRTVAEASGREDLVFPTDFKRDENGRIVACCALARFV